jgi:hypothetical protein
MKLSVRSWPDAESRVPATATKVLGRREGTRYVTEKAYRHGFYAWPAPACRVVRTGRAAESVTELCLLTGNFWLTTSRESS